MLRPITFAFALVCAPAVQAQNANCASHDQVVARLADGYGESRQSMGLAANNTVVEVFASAETGTWTITVTRPGGPTCLVASGEGWRQVGDTEDDTPA